MFAKHLSYSNLIASIALFVALGGTAVAAATLTRDSVGSAQIRKDAVRSPEIQKDAVRSPELQKDAVRSSEILNETIKVGDIAAQAESALLADLKVAESTEAFVPGCDGTDLGACRNLLAVRLDTSADTGAGTRQRPNPGGQVDPEQRRNWLIQAKLTIDDINPRDPDRNNRCGLVLDSSSGPDAVLDEARHHLAANDDPGESQAIAVTAVFTDDRFVDPRIALRCTEDDGEELVAEDQKLTALEVGKVVGP
jgi:hypothetical protein